MAHHHGLPMGQILDMFQCVERLHELDPLAMKRLVQRERMLAVPRLDRQLPFKVDLLELLARLPLHIIACALVQEPCPGGAGALLPHSVFSTVSLLFR
jgi:hypothetical protein